MNQLSKTVYAPLLEFCQALQALHPKDLPDLSRLISSVGTGDWELLHVLGAGCTTELLLACLSKDAVTFFQSESTNALLQYIGGRTLYDHLDPLDQEVYWSEHRLSGIIRQCRILHAFEPLKQNPTLQAILDKASSLPPTGTTEDKHRQFQAFLLDPVVLAGFLELLESPDSTAPVIGCLSTIIEAMLLEPPSPPETYRPAALTSPGAYLQKQRVQRSQQNKKVQHSMLQSILGLLESLRMDATTQSAQTVDPSTVAQIVEVLSSCLGSGGSLDLPGLLHRGGLQDLLGQVGEKVTGTGGGQTNVLPAEMLQKLLGMLGPSAVGSNLLDPQTWMKPQTVQTLLKAVSATSRPADPARVGVRSVHKGRRAHKMRGG